jgi:flagellar biosynthetic protein FliR
MIDALPLLQVGILLVRPGVLLLVAPAFSGVHAPAHVTIGLTVLLALAVLPAVAVPVPNGSLAITLVVAREASIGLALGLALKALIAAVELAGHLAGFQLGLSYSAIVDPQSGVRNNLVAVLYVNIALVTFLLVNGHHAFLRALVASYQQLPVGVGGIGGSLGDSVAELLGLVFSVGTRLAAPLVLVLVVVEAVMAMAARTAPTFNLMVIGAPLRLLIGLVLLALTIPAVTRIATRAADAVVSVGQRNADAFR